MWTCNVLVLCVYCTVLSMLIDSENESIVDFGSQYHTQFGDFDCVIVLISYFSSFLTRPYTSNDFTSSY